MIRDLIIYNSNRNLDFETTYFRIKFEAQSKPPTLSHYEGQSKLDNNEKKKKTIQLKLLQ